MNWNPLTWLRRTDSKDSEDDDSAPEPEADTCDHENTDKLRVGDEVYPNTMMDPHDKWCRRCPPVTIEAGHLVIRIVREHKTYCTDCGETFHYGDYSTEKVAIPIEYWMDADRSVEDAVTTPVSADYTVTEDGEVTPDSDDEGGRIIVNESVANDEPVESGGATD